MRVAFLLQDLQLRPGVGAVVAHAASLDGASIVLTREQEHRHWAYPGLESVPLVPFATALDEPWDVVLCSGGATAAAALDLNAARHACLLVEDDTVAGVAASALPLRFLARTRAHAALLADLQPGNEPLHVPAPVTPAPPAPSRDGVLDLAVAAADRPAHDAHAVAVAAASVVVALAPDPYDSVPLALASGTPVVATTGHPDAELVEHGVNGILLDHGDTLFLDEATRRAAALAPAAPSPVPLALRAALDRVLADPPPPASAVARRVASELTTHAAEAEQLRDALARAHAGPPPPRAAPSVARRAARAAKRRLKR